MLEPIISRLLRFPIPLRVNDIQDPPQSALPCPLTSFPLSILTGSSHPDLLVVCPAGRKTPASDTYLPALFSAGNSFSSNSYMAGSLNSSRSLLIGHPYLHLPPPYPPYPSSSPSSCHHQRSSPAWICLLIFCVPWLGCKPQDADTWCVLFSVPLVLGRAGHVEGMLSCSVACMNTPLRFKQEEKGGERSRK